MFLFSSHGVFFDRDFDSVFWICRLQYAVVNIGTPSKAYFVALDTGSDLLWVPCVNCVSCGPTHTEVFSPIYVSRSSSNR